VRAGGGRVCAIPRIEQSGKTDHQVNPGGTRGKWLEGGEASSALGVEKHAARSDAPESSHKKIARYSGSLIFHQRKARVNKCAPFLALYRV
jgi:hypothetical protein